MAERQAGAAGGGADSSSGSEQARAVGVLESVRGVARGVASQRQELEAAWSAARQTTRNSARQVAALDAALAQAAAGEAVLQARRSSLDSVARRQLRTEIWQALQTDRARLESHEGGRRLAVAWLCSLTADEERNWQAEVWVPVVAPPPDTGPALVLWETGIDACAQAMAELQPGGPGPEIVSSEGLLGLRVTPLPGTSRDTLAAALVRAMDRTRVQAVPLHQLRIEVSVVWLDLSVTLDGPPTRLSGVGPEEIDTLVGEVVR